jgi:putative tricarboxylic transport membrane protein
MEKSRDRKDIAGSLFLLAVGLLLADQSRRLLVWSRYGPEEGFFPLLIALLLVGLSLGVLGRSVFFRGTRKGPSSTQERGEGAVSIFRVAAYGLAMLLFGLLMESGGFFLMGTFFLLFILKGVEKHPWKTALAVGLLTIACSYLLFQYWLGVPLPRGILRGLSI